MRSSSKLLLYLAGSTGAFYALASEKSPLAPALNGWRAQATSLELRHLGTAIMMSDDALAGVFPEPDQFEDVIKTKMNKPDLAALDGWDRPYRYRLTSGGFEIRSVGGDGKLGGGDDLTYKWGAGLGGAGLPVARSSGDPRRSAAPPETDADLRKCRWGWACGDPASLQRKTPKARRAWNHVKETRSRTSGQASPMH